MTSPVTSIVERISGSRFFDLEFYQQESGISFGSSGEAVSHYVREGARRGLNPSQEFDTRFYVGEIGKELPPETNPLDHFLRIGRAAGRAGTADNRRLAKRPAAPAAEVWEKLARLGRAAFRERQAGDDTQESVDVIVPVYAGHAETLACLCSVLRSRNRTPFRLIVIDDASPDPELVRSLDRLSDLRLISLHRNETNLGFVKTANAGLVLSRRRDVVLLNADAIVAGDWLDRLRAHSESTERVASVTPLSNNATILSYPRANKNNNQALEIDFQDLDAATASINAGMALEIPTGIGFCFYMPRGAIDTIGHFDEQTFGRGYGEENDYCRRAADMGWKNLAALDVFVRHIGNISFDADSEQLMAAAKRKLDRLHPRYQSEVDAFIQRDLLATTRERLDLWRLRRACAGGGVLMIVHTWGGGTIKQLKSEAERLAEEDIPVVVASPDASGALLKLQGLGDLDVPNLPPLDLSRPTEVAELLRTLGLTRVHIHSLVGVDFERFDDLRAALRSADLTLEVTLHDYAAVCPRLFMVDWTGGYCASPSVEYCQICVAKAGTPFGDLDVRRWRRAHLSILESADAVNVPHEDMRARLASYAPDLELRVRRHAYQARLASRPSPPNLLRTFRNDGRQVVGIIGALGLHKGARLLVSLAADAQLRGLPLHFVIYGYSSEDHRLSRMRHVTLTGRYTDEELDDRLGSQPCNFAFIPSVGPETFCFTLDHVFRNGIYPVVFDLGAPAARVREAGFGCVLPRVLMFDPQALNDRLIKIEPMRPARWPIREAGREYTIPRQHEITP